MSSSLGAGVPPGQKVLRTERPRPFQPLRLFGSALHIVDKLLREEYRTVRCHSCTEFHILDGGLRSAYINLCCLPRRASVSRMSEGQTSAAVTMPMPIEARLLYSEIFPGPMQTKDRTPSTGCHSIAARGERNTILDAEIPATLAAF